LLFPSEAVVVNAPLAGIYLNMLSKVAVRITGRKRIPQKKVVTAVLLFDFEIFIGVLS